MAIQELLEPFSQNRDLLPGVSQAPPPVLLPPIEWRFLAALLRTASDELENVILTCPLTRNLNPEELGTFLEQYMLWAGNDFSRQPDEDEVDCSNLLEYFADRLGPVSQLYVTDLI